MKTAIKDVFTVQTFHSRFFMLFLSTLTCLGVFYCQDIPSIVKEDFIAFIEKQSPGNSDYYFNLMYSTYSFPNIILPILSGILIDKIGYGLPLIIFSGLNFLGNAIVCAGIHVNSIFVVLLGRCVFGMGGESMIITQSALLVYWFKGKELGFSQALSLSLGRAASVMNCYVSPKVVESGLASSYAVAMGICALSFLAAMLAGIIDVSARARQTEINPVRLSNNSLRDSVRQLATSNQTSQNIMDQLYKCKPIVWFHIAAICMFYLAYLPFSMIASGFFEEKWYKGREMNQGEKVKEIGQLLSIPLIISALLFPVFGFTVDKFGRRLHFLLLAASLLITSYCLFLTTSSEAPLVVLGLSYAIFGAICWSALALLVPQKIIGTIFGLVTILQNFTLTIFPIFLAYLTTKHSSSLESIMSLLVNSVATLVLVCIVWFYDSKSQVSLKSVDQEKIIKSVEDEYAKEELNPENRIFDDYISDEEDSLLL